MNYSCDSGLDNSIDTPFRMEDYVVFSNQNPKQEYMINCSSTSEIPANLLDEPIHTDMTENYFIASSPTESGYCSSSDGYSTHLIPLSVELLSSNDSSHSFYQTKSDKTTKAKKQPRSSFESQSSDEFSLNKRGRPLQKTKVYDDEIDKAVAENDHIQLKIARNKKSSQVYRLKKKNKALKTEKKNEKLQNKKLKLIEKLEKYIASNLKLKESFHL